jgi:diguanylate cyclase (GGDEF)-like protein/PAS domain S-box-containing protein
MPVISAKKFLSGSDAETGNEKHSAQIRDAQIGRLFTQVPVNLSANLINVLIILFVFWDEIAPVTLIGWAVYAQTVNLCGLILLLAHRAFQARASNEKWAKWFTVYGTADGITWGAAALLLLIPDNTFYTLFLCLIVIANLQGGLTSFLSYRPVMVLFIVSVLVPFAIRFASIGEIAYYALAGLSLMYCGNILSMGLRFHRNLIDAWRLRFELQESESALRESRDSLEIRVSERTQQLREANEELQKSEALYRAVVEVQTELLCRFMPGGRLTFANDAFCRFFEAERDGLIGSEFLSIHRANGLLPLAEAEKILNCVAGLTPNNSTGTCETLAPDDEGTTRWLMWTHRALFDENGRVLEYQSVAIDITERKEAEERIEFIAHHDALTELPNRLLFQNHLEDIIRQPSKRHRSTAILLFDLDDFKHVNEALGHYYGDMLLREMAWRLQECMRDGDVLARLGGDEFGVIMRDVTSPHDVAQMAERVLEELDRAVVVEEHMIAVGASAGITLYPEDSSDAGRLLKNADLALYRAKGRGRATYEFYSQDLAKQAERRLEVITGIREAISNEQFHMVYQPKIRLEDGEIIGSEALIRWTHPEEGMVSPGEFIPIAETTGLSVPIGDWVLREVCRQLRMWRAADLPLKPVSVNLSAIQFTDRRFIEKARGAMRDNSIDPKLIEFEITETAIMNDVEASVETMKDIVKLGSRLSIDDFGTGYSSFGYLRQMPIAEIKIDRSFLIDAADSSEDQAILKAMIDLGHSLGLSVLTEGVETTEQYQLLQDLHCDNAQGFLMSRPLTADAFEAKLQEVETAPALADSPALD